MLLLALFWIAWCALHSLLITRQVNSYITDRLGQYSNSFRVLFNLFSLITLIPVLWYQFSLDEKILFERNIPLTIVQLLLLGYALLMFYLGARVYDMSYFLGLSQWHDAGDKKKKPALPFHTDGILSAVRHPWYGAGITFIWGFGNVTDVYVLTRIILTSYFIIGTFLEEKRLLRELGNQYREYCRTVPMLFPWKGFGTPTRK